MKSFLLATFCCLVLNAYTQQDLRFSQALFIGMNSRVVANFIAKDTTLTVPEGKVWQITSAHVSATEVNPEKIAVISSAAPVPEYTHLYLNGIVIASENIRNLPEFNPMWLPAGKYRVTISTEDRTEKGNRYYYNAFLSGIEYDLPN